MVKNPPASVADMGLIPGLERSSRGGHGSPLQYSCLENPMDRGAWQRTVHPIAELDTTEHAYRIGTGNNILKIIEESKSC